MTHTLYKGKGKYISDLTVITHSFKRAASSQVAVDCSWSCDLHPGSAPGRRQVQGKPQKYEKYVLMP